MCECFCDTIEDNPDFLDHVWFSDEAHFLLSGHVNSKNNVYCGTTPPEEVLQRLLHSVTCTAWVAISKHDIIGPYWFEDENERAKMMNNERYVAVMRKFWASLGRRRGTDRDEQWFQQDEATPPHQITLLNEWECDFRKDWSAGTVTSSGHLIYRTSNHLIFICGDIWRTMCIRTILKPLVSSRLQLQENALRGVHASDWHCATVVSLSSTPRRTFGSYSGESITFVQSIQDYWNVWA